MDQKELKLKIEYELETGKPAEITIRYDSPEYLVWYINKRLNQEVADVCTCGKDRCGCYFNSVLKCLNCGNPITVQR